MSRINMSDGSIYEGEVYDGIPNGFGIKKWENGEWLEGEWDRGMFRNGKGVRISNYEDSNGIMRNIRYEGEFKDGYQDGFGTETDYTDGSMYSGGWKKGSHYGKGHEIYAPLGLTLEGNWEGIAGAEGYGTITYADGRRYEGPWKGVFPDGIGTMIYPDGTKRTGKWSFGNPA